MAQQTSIISSMLRRKSVEDAIAETADPDRHLKRTLTAWDLTILGVAVTVGAGIFSIGAQAAAGYAGPAVVISFLIAAVVCGLAAVCYAEFASVVPVSGSAYTYSYVAMGEFVGWMIGWLLILETLLSSAAVSKVWGFYLHDAFALANINLPITFDIGPVTVSWAPLLLALVFTILLIQGTQLSTRVNEVITAIKVGVVILVIVVGAFYINFANYSPFLPESQPAASHETGVQQSLFSWITGSEPTMYGIYGLFAGAALVFFAFGGFDIVATTAEEAKDPQKTVPRGLFGGLAIITVLYTVISFVVTGMVSYKDLATSENPSLSTAFRVVGADWAATVIALGIVVALTSVVMVMLYGGARVLFSMSRDGLLPRGLSKTNKAHATPARTSIIAGISVGLAGALFPVEVLEELVVCGLLCAFVVVSFGVPILRRSRPDLKRGFRVPWSPVIPIISGIASLWLMTNLTIQTWIRFVVWVAIGIVVYFAYARWHSTMNETASVSEPEITPQQ